jgi:hypothetical protein
MNFYKAIASYLLFSLIASFAECANAVDRSGSTEAEKEKKDLEAEEYLRKMVMIGTVSVSTHLTDLLWFAMVTTLALFASELSVVVDNQSFMPSTIGSTRTTAVPILLSQTSKRETDHSKTMIINF